MSALRPVAGWIGQVLAWSVILLALAVLAIAVVVPRIGGATPYTIETGSMSPGMPPGTLVVARPVPADRLRVGDVVTYQLDSGEPTVVTHRIVAMSVKRDGTRLFQTQGDANNAPDARWVLPVQIRGERWYAVPVLGRANLLLTGAQHQRLVYGAVALLLGYAAVMFAGAGRERWRRRRAAQEPVRLGAQHRADVHGAGR
jgi:signal peptidase I